MTMKPWPTILIILLVALVAAGCGSATSAPVAAPAPAEAPGDAPAGSSVAAPASAPAAAPATTLDTTYESALPLRNQLLLGTLELEESDFPITTQQAPALLTLWQGIRASMNSGAAAPAETDALLRQIQASLTPDQINAIREMRLTQVQLQEWARNAGVSTGTGELGATGQGQGGGQGLSPEARATRQAERGGVGEGGGLSRALLDAVIELMESK